MGNLTYGLTEWGDFVGERWDTEDDAKEAVRATAAGWIANCDEASHQILGDPATLQELRDKLVGDLNHEGFEIGWDCLGGDWWGITVVNDVSMVIITGGDGGNGARLGDKAEHIGMGFYHEGGWIADMPEAPTDWAEFVKAIRSWIIEGTLPEEVKS